MKSTTSSIILASLINNSLQSLFLPYAEKAGAQDRLFFKDWALEDGKMS